MTRTTGDLIQDLDHTVTAQDALYDEVRAALVVGFNGMHECRMVFSDDPDRHENLNVMVGIGGTPLGFIKLNRTGNEIALMSRPLAEYAGDPAAAAFFTGLCTGLGRRVACGDTKFRAAIIGQHSLTRPAISSALPVTDLSQGSS